MSWRAAHPSTDGRPLAVMLLASVLIHAALLAGGRLPVPSTVPQASVISVRLQADSRSHAQGNARPAPPATRAGPPPARPQPARPAVRRTPTVTPPPPAPVPRIAEAGSPVTLRPSTEALAGPAATPPEEARADATAASRILAEIRLALARHFRYPPLARRLGWEGEVVLGFRLHADGRIDDIHIARPSGHRLLDRSARKALERVQRVRLAAGLIEGSRVLELPVQYRLTDS